MVVVADVRTQQFPVCLSQSSQGPKEAEVEEEAAGGGCNEPTGWEPSTIESCPFGRPEDSTVCENGPEL